MNLIRIAKIKLETSTKTFLPTIAYNFVCEIGWYTSQRCSKYGHIERNNRKSQSCFKCKNCGFQLNTDLNVNRNIIYKHLNTTDYPNQVNVNLPNSNLFGNKQIYTGGVR